MNYGIGNVKAKSSGGGGIPQITIEATQFTDATHIQFTQDQYNTIVNNGCVNIDIAGSGTLLFTMQNNSINANVYLYSVSDNYTASTNAIEFATIELNKTTYVGTLNQNSYEKSSGGKQLYQHNIKITNNDNYTYGITIINDIATQMDFSAIAHYLYDNGFNGTDVFTNVSGGKDTGGVERTTFGAYSISDYTTIYFDGIGTTTSIYSSVSLRDKVKPL